VRDRDRPRVRLGVRGGDRLQPRDDAQPPGRPAERAEAPQVLQIEQQVVPTPSSLLNAAMRSPATTTWARNVP